MLPNTLILFFLILLSQVICPVGLLIWLWRRSEDRLHWLRKLLVTSTFVMVMYLTGGAWAWTSYYLRDILLALLVIVALKSAWQASNLPNWPNWSVRTGLSLVAQLSVIALFSISLYFAIAGRTYPDEVVELTFPLTHGVYFIHHGGSNPVINHHSPFESQQFALDILKLNGFGRRASGFLPETLTRYEIFGEPLSSPCDGEVLATENDLPDLTPPSADPEHPAGNHVMVHCKEVDVLLAHMMQGSVLVTPGELVQTGQPIGKVGNSGNTSEPHLHIHARRSGSGEGILDGIGVPMLFSERFLVRNDLVNAQ